jgi:hypothetical protein
MTGGDFQTTEMTADELFEWARVSAQDALRLCLLGQRVEAEALLLPVRTLLRRESGDLAIVRRGTDEEGSEAGRAFGTRSLAEARAWGWLELACGVLQLSRAYPGVSLMYFSRAWRIWRPWSRTAGGAEGQEALRERIRASLWLGEAWARLFSERAEPTARAILRAALSELANFDSDDLLQETLEQQALLPPALPGTPAFAQDKPAPFVTRMM